MMLGSPALAARPSWELAEGTGRAARRVLLVAGVALAGTVGLLAPRLGLEPALAGLVGCAVLAAAVASGYAALIVLVALLLVPIGVGGELPLQLNEIDLVFGAGLFGLVARMATAREPVLLRPLGIALAGFILAGCVALAAGLLASADPARALSQFRGLFAYALVPMLVFSLGERAAQRRRSLVALLCVAGALTALRGVLSWAELNDVLRLGGWLHRVAAPDEGGLVGVVPSASGRFGYARAWAGNFEGNTLGVLMILVLPSCAYLAFRAGSAAARPVFAAGTVLLTMALVMSYSRGAYVGAAVASLPALYLFWRRNPRGALVIAAAGGALLFYLVTHLAGAEDRLVTLRTLSDDPTVLHRQLVYEQIAAAVRQNPLWGVGLGTSVRAIRTGGDSLYLFLLLRGGLLVTGAAAALAWFAGREVVVAFRAGRMRGLDLAIGCGLFGFAVHSLIDYTLWNPKVALVVWLLVGLLLAPALDRQKPGEAAG